MKKFFGFFIAFYYCLKSIRAEVRHQKQFMDEWGAAFKGKSDSEIRVYFSTRKVHRNPYIKA